MTVSTQEQPSTTTEVHKRPATESDPGGSALPDDAGSSNALATSVLAVALGGLAVAIAYALSRAEAPGATTLYWVGQALIVLPVALRVLSPSAGARERMALLLAMAVVQSLLAWCYSPDQFRFPDELQHMRTAVDILSTHHLFHPNSFLEVSPGFPGMEEVTTAVALLTGLSPFHAGVVTVSAVHLALPICLFLLYRELTDDARIAGIATLIYTTAPHYAYFNALFVYSAVALPFLVLSVRAALRSYQHRKSALWIVLPFLPMMFTHHLTAFVGAAILAAIAIVVGLSPGGRSTGLRLACTTLGLALMTILWTAHRSPSTFSYLAGPVREVLTGLAHPGGSKHPKPIASVAPYWESLVAISAAGITAACVLGGIAVVWRQGASRFARLATFLGLTYPALLVVRIVAPNGPELATRALTYGMLLAAFPAAAALVRLWPSHGAGVRAAFATAIAATLAMGAIVTGLPPSWERLPGRFHVAAFESGIDRHVTAEAEWAHDTWSPYQRVACDVSACSVLAGYSRATVSTAASPMYYASSTAALDQHLSALTSDYVAVDQRWTRQTPATGQYFFRDVLEVGHQRPLASSLLVKFDRNPRIDRLYDNGPIQLYDTRRVWGG